MMLAATLLFWSSVGALVYVYAGFPVVAWTWGALRPRPVRQGSVTPRMSLVIAAYNEARGIAAKLDNAFALEYPPERLEIIVASDGSDDGTDAIVASYAHRGVQLLSLPRLGKLHALDAAIARARGDILVFSDANTHFQSDALRMLARNFADPEVGGVCGNQRHLRRRERDNSGQGERLYWSYDKWIKALESRSGSIVAADGAIYAIRRSLYRKPPTAAVTDDFAISTGVIEQGHRLVYEHDAVAWEDTAGHARGEFGRKVRITTRGWQGILLRRGLLDPRRYGFYALVLLSHKILRRLAPAFLLVLFVSSLILARRGWLYTLAAGGQLAFYALAVLGGMLRGTPLGRAKPLYAPFFFVLANGAALLGLLRILRGKKIESWQPQRPAAEAAGASEAAAGGPGATADRPRRPLGKTPVS